APLWPASWPVTTTSTWPRSRARALAAASSGPMSRRPSRPAPPAGGPPSPSRAPSRAPRPPPGSRSPPTPARPTAGCGATPTAGVPAPAKAVGADDEGRINANQRIAGPRLTRMTGVPTFELSATVEVDELLALRGQLNDQLAEDGIRLSVTDLLVRASAVAL